MPKNEEKPRPADTTTTITTITTSMATTSLASATASPIPSTISPGSATAASPAAAASSADPAGGEAAGPRLKTRSEPPFITDYDEIVVECALLTLKQIVYPRKDPKNVLVEATEEDKAAIKRDAFTKVFPIMIHLEAKELIMVMRRLWEEAVQLETEEYEAEMEAVTEEHLGSEEILEVGKEWDMEGRWSHQLKFLVLDLLKQVTVTFLRSSHNQELFDLLRLFLITSGNEEIIDEIAKTHLSCLAYLEPAETWPRMDKWIEEDNTSIQRAVVLHQHGLGDFTDRTRLLKYCSQLVKLRSREVAQAVEEALYTFARTNLVGKTLAGASFVKTFVDKEYENASVNVKSAFRRLKKSLPELMPIKRDLNDGEMPPIRPE